MSSVRTPLLAISPARWRTILVCFVAGFALFFLPALYLLVFADFDSAATRTELITAALPMAVGFGALAAGFACTRYVRSIGRQFREAHGTQIDPRRHLRKAIFTLKPVDLDDAETELAGAYARYNVDVLPLTTLQSALTFLALIGIAISELRVGLLFAIGLAWIALLVAFGVTSLIVGLRTVAKARGYLENLPAGSLA